MNSEENSEYELIGKFISGEITPEERQQLSTWLNESEEHRNLFAGIQRFESYSRTYNDIQGVNVSLAKELTWYKINKANRLKEEFRSEINDNVKRFYRRRILKYAASILVVAGATSWLYLGLFKTKTVTPNAITQVNVPKGSRTNLTLADGTSVWLNAGSVLKYDNNFNKKDRVVYLEGEAFFDVTKNAKKPFYVKTSDISMKVLGTSFNVKSYHEEGTIQTTLVTGSVVIEKNDAQKNDNKVILKPNQKAIFFKKQEKLVVDEIINQQVASKVEKKSLSVESITSNASPKKEEILIADKVNIEQDVSWKDGYLIIKQEPLENLAVKLARRYDVVFKFQSEDIKKYRYTGKISDLTLEQVLNAIKFSSPIDYKVDKKLVIISKK